jgi:hypothetical protein
MMRFVEQAIARAGLGVVLERRRAGDFAALHAHAAALRTADLLVLGAIADAVRAFEIGDVARIHVGRLDPAVTWVTADDELELLRSVALARVLGERAAAVGVDWGKSGLELAQVALGFGASDLFGPITKKSGLVVLESETRKVKGKGLVSLSAIKKREIARLVESAGRIARFTDEDVSSPLVEAIHA